MVRVLIALAFLAVFVVGCATNPVTGKEQLSLISTSDEVSMGQKIDQQVRSQYPVVTGTPAAERVQRVGARIAAASDRKDLTYHYALIQSKDVNAFATPGGYIYVTTAAEQLAQPDDELAAVLGHETGHVAARHSVQQLQDQMGYTLLKDLILGTKGGPAAQAAADVAFNSIIMTGFSRKDEYQADQLGVKYAAKAGYDPYGEANFFAKLAKVTGPTNKNFEFLMDHPDTEARRQKALALAAQYSRPRQGGARTAVQSGG